MTRDEKVLRHGWRDATPQRIHKSIYRRDKVKIYTIENGRISEGMKVEPRLLSSGVTIPAVVVGEKGRGRKESFLPVELTDRKTFDENGEATVYHCSVGKTLRGGHKLIEQNDGDESKCLVVMRTGIGFRGTNFHTGDRVDGSDTEFLPFPCEVLTEGIIAQGDAGRMGSGRQMIAIAPRGVVFRASRAGRLYGQPGSHYYLFTGERLMCATWEERIAADLF